MPYHQAESTTQTSWRGRPLGLSVRTLWGLVILFYGFGDTSTTLIGFSTGKVIEIEPLTRLLINTFGVYTILPIKLIGIGLWYHIWRVFPAPYAFVIPLLLALGGALATGWNLYVILALYR